MLRSTKEAKGFKVISPLGAQTWFSPASWAWFKLDENSSYVPGSKSREITRDKRCASGGLGIHTHKQTYLRPLRGSKPKTREFFFAQTLRLNPVAFPCVKIGIELTTNMSSVSF